MTDSTHLPVTVTEQTEATECETDRVETFELEVQRDHLERLASVPAWAAICDLIWNSLDAEATAVDIESTDSVLAGSQAIGHIVVADNGHGFDVGEAREQFARLGGSWKAGRPKSRNGVTSMHGRNGEGRFKALALGANIAWQSRTVAGATVAVRLHKATARTVAISESPIGGLDFVGTVVAISDPTPSASWLLKHEAAIAKLTGVFAIRLMEDRQLTIRLNGQPLQPADLQVHTANYPLSVDDAGTSAVLDIIEWSIDVDRKLNLCTASGMPLGELPPGIQAPSFNFTAYVRWEGFESNLEMIDLAEGDARMAPVIEAARAAMRDHFRRRASERDPVVLAQWKQDDIYPYQGEAADTSELLERHVFDLTALTMSAASPAFGKSERQAKKITLRLLRESVARSPESVHLILSEVLKLDKQRLDELAGLVAHTDLSKIVAAANTVAHRLNFIEALDHLLFDHKKHVNERDHLHRILNEELWIFGDAWSHAISERTLTNVLRDYEHMLGRDRNAVVDAVTTADGNGLRRVDLMLSAAVAGVRHRKRDNLVIELKRPSLNLGLGELNQIKSYAGAIMRDERFHVNDAYWEFWLIGNSLDQDLRAETQEQSDRRPGLAAQSKNHKIFVFTWAQIIEQARRRLEFMRTTLQFQSTDDDAIRMLRGLYKKYLPDQMTA